MFLEPMAASCDIWSVAYNVGTISGNHGAAGQISVFVRKQFTSHIEAHL